MNRSLVLIGLFLLAGPAAAQTPTPGVPKEVLKAELLADTTGVRPGGTFRVGVLFKITPGWHIYWKNPGDAGLATSVQFKAPEGFRVGELGWPLPSAWNQPGNIIGYGYSDTVMLSAEVQAPANLPAGSVPLSAEVRWLGCAHVCIPGQASVKLELPVNASAAAANAELFETWTKRLPVAADTPGSPLTAKAAGNLKPEEGTGTFMLLLTWKAQPSEVSWFPEEHPALKLESMSLKTEGQNTQITFTAALQAGQELSPETLQTVVAYTEEGGERRGVIVPVSLREPAEQKKP